jgi:RNase P subunit RPR2
VEEKTVELAAARRLAEGRDAQDSEAEYTLEYSVACPACEQIIRTVKVVRMLRTRVNFTSTLPRHGRVVICPECRTVLSAALTIA